MSAPEDLNAQLAQRLFGWEWNTVLQLWEDPARGLWVDADIPRYTTDPAATAQVWQWVEQQSGLLDVWFNYVPLAVECQIILDDLVYPERLRRVRCPGATWPEALCRAALALAEALEGEKP